MPAEFREEPSSSGSPILKPTSTTADATVSFAEMKPLPSGAGKPAADVTVSLADTPARVPVPSSRGLPALGDRGVGAGPQGKTLFGLSPVALAAKARESAPSRPKPAAAQGKTLFGLPPVSAGQARGAAGSAPLVANVTTPEPAAREQPASTEAEVSAVAEPEPAAATAQESTAAPVEGGSDRTQDVSLSDLSSVELAAQVPEVPATSQGAPPASAEEVTAEPSDPFDQRPNPSSAEPAPRPRSALKYGLWAAVPVGLCAAWLAMRTPWMDGSAPRAIEVASESKGGAQSEPAALAPIAAKPPATMAATSAPTPEPALAAQPAPEETAEAQEPSSPATEEPAVEAASAPATADGDEESAEADPDAEDSEVEVDASRKVVAARADKLVNEGHALRRKKKLAPARAKYRAALAAYPGYPRALAGLAQIAIQQRDGKAAVKLARQLVKLRPAQVSYQVLLGDAYKVAGKPALAKEAWKDAARKGNAAAKARLGQ